MKYRKNNKAIVIACDYWTATHDLAKGATLSQLIFKRGNRKNILVSPVTSYIRRREEREYISYEESFWDQPVVSVEKTDERITIEVTGTYRSSKGTKLPVDYRRIWAYEPSGLVRTHLEMLFREPVDQITQVGIAGMRLVKSLRTVGFRGPRMDPDAQAGSGSVWHEYSATGQPYSDFVFNMGRSLPLYFCAVERGVEGIELFFGDEVEAYNSAFVDAGAQQQYCAVVEDHQTDSRELRIEPYAHWRNPIAVGAGAYGFDYYLGLPFSKGKNRVPPPLYHAGISNRWPDEQSLDALAEAGIRIIRLHNDYREDGNFWHDGCYPPYDAQNMKAMDRVIEQVHQRNMEIVPYFSLKELHPEAPEFANFAEQWKRTTDQKQTILHNLRGGGEFGAQMCMRSGWLKFRQNSIDQVLSRHDFDGVYYDWCMALHCLHPAHCGGRPHVDMDGFIEFLHWTRRRIGPGKRLCLHLSSTPMMVAENLADFVITHEELQGILPSPGEFHPETDYAGICSHHLCRPAASRKPGKDRLFVLSAFLEGLWTWPALNQPGDFVLEEIRKLSRFDLPSYSFEPAHSHPVQVDGGSTMASLYWKNNSALLFVANLSPKDTTVALRVDLARKGWPSRQKINLLTSGRNALLSVRELAGNGVRLRVPGLSSRVIECRLCTPPGRTMHSRVGQRAHHEV